RVRVGGGGARPGRARRAGGAGPGVQGPAARLDPVGDYERAGAATGRQVRPPSSVSISRQGKSPNTVEVPVTTCTAATEPSAGARYASGWPPGRSGWRDQVRPESVVSHSVEPAPSQPVSPFTKPDPAVRGSTPAGAGRGSAHVSPPSPLTYTRTGGGIGT